MQEPRTGSTGTLIAEEHDQKKVAPPCGAGSQVADLFLALPSASHDLIGFRSGYSHVDPKPIRQSFPLPSSSLFCITFAAAVYNLVRMRNLVEAAT